MLRTREEPPPFQTGRNGPAIEACGLVMRYGDREVLHGIDLVVPHGMVVGFLGPNRAGKTTPSASGWATFAALGVAYTRLVASADSAPALANAAYLPLLFLSGAWFPVSGLPHWLASLANAFPLAPMLDGMRQALVFGHGPAAIWPDVRKLVVGVVVSLRTFRWERAA